MPILFFDLARAVWALRRDAGFVALAALVALLVAGGTVFYCVVEHLRPVDAVYLTVMTLTTVGYGDLAPETAGGKVFTAVFVLAGMGILVAFLSMIASQIRRRSVLRGPVSQHGRLHRPAEAQTAIGLSGAGAYDLLVVGSANGGRETAIDAARSGLRVVVVDAEHAPPQLRATRRR